MEVKRIAAVFLIPLLFTSCEQGPSAVPPTVTTVPTTTITSTPLVATSTPHDTSEISEPTNETASPLSAEGPWLLYLHNTPKMSFAGAPAIPAEFILINQDGSGRTSITLPECRDKISDFLMNNGYSSNYLARYKDGLYLFRPSKATGILVHQHKGYSVCHTYFSGNEKGGLLASFFQASNEVSPELILFELPSGEIRERFPLVRCSEDSNVCKDFISNWHQMMEQNPQWSPDGRYLAFVAVMDATSSDLFVYDAQNGNLLRLTHTPDWVGQIEWAPNGEQIIMQEMLNDIEFFFAPYSKPPTSVWSISILTSEAQFLYPTDDAYTVQNTLFWLDDQRFIAYEGSLVGADQATNLRVVDMGAGTNQILFNGNFVMVSYDPVHGVFALFELESEKYPQGIYLVTMDTGSIQYLEGHPTFPDWDENSGLFVSNDPCENDPQRLLAFDFQGNFKCVPKPTPTHMQLETANYPAPNGEWNISLKDGLWLETGELPAVLVKQEEATDIIWCPDSLCFFFSVAQEEETWALYRVSLPDLTIEMVDEGIESTGTYQWLGGE